MVILTYSVSFSCIVCKYVSSWWLKSFLRWQPTPTPYPPYLTVYLTPPKGVPNLFFRKGCSLDYLDGFSQLLFGLGRQEKLFEGWYQPLPLVRWGSIFPTAQNHYIKCKHYHLCHPVPNAFKDQIAHYHHHDISVWSYNLIHSKIVSFILTACVPVISHDCYVDSSLFIPCHDYSITHITLHEAV